MARARTDAGTRRDVQHQLQELKATDQLLAASLRDTRAERRKLAAQIRALEAHAALSEQLTDPAMTLLTAQLQGGTIAEAAALVLQERGPMRVVDLLTVLQDAGKLRRSEWAYSTLFTSLSRGDRFERAPAKRGYWQLRQPFRG